MIRKVIKRLSITSLILGLLTFFEIDFLFFGFLFGILGAKYFFFIPILAILALTFGIRAKIKIKELGIDNESIKKDKSKSEYGIILAIIALLKYFANFFI